MMRNALITNGDIWVWFWCGAGCAVAVYAAWLIGYRIIKKEWPV